MKKLFDDVVTWFKNPDPDTVLLKVWQRKRTRAKVIHKLEVKQQAEADKEIVAKQAYLLWEADGKPEGKEDYYWSLAIDKSGGDLIRSPTYLSFSDSVLATIDIRQSKLSQK